MIGTFFLHYTTQKSTDTLIKIVPVAVAIVGTPVVAHAGTISSLVLKAHAILTALVPLLVGIGLVIFLTGVVRFIAQAGNDTARASARQLMLWGIIILTVMTSLWGFVNIVVETFEINRGAVPHNVLLP